jgi:hypothetical protein
MFVTNARIDVLFQTLYTPSQSPQLTVVTVRGHRYPEFVRQARQGCDLVDSGSDFAVVTGRSTLFVTDPHNERWHDACLRDPIVLAASVNV